MIGRGPFYQGAGFRQTWKSADLLDRAELILLLMTAGTLLFLAGIWLRGSLAGGAPPVTATVTVQAGDTLWGFAKEYGDPDQYILERVNALTRANKLEKGRALHEGQTLVIPVGNPSARLYYGGKYASRQGAD